MQAYTFFIPKLLYHKKFLKQTKSDHHLNNFLIKKIDILASQENIFKKSKTLSTNDLCICAKENMFLASGDVDSKVRVCFRELVVEALTHLHKRKINIKIFKHKQPVVDAKYFTCLGQTSVYIHTNSSYVYVAKQELAPSGESFSMHLLSCW